MPDSRATSSKADNSKSRERHSSPLEATTATTESAVGVLEPYLGDAYGAAAFQRHAAMLGDPRISRRTNASQRVAIVRRLQRDYGNQYVQRLVNHVVRAKQKEEWNEFSDGSSLWSGNGQPPQDAWSNVQRAEESEGSSSTAPAVSETGQQPTSAYAIPVRISLSLDRVESELIIQAVDWQPITEPPGGFSDEESAALSKLMGEIKGYVETKYADALKRQVERDKLEITYSVPLNELAQEDLRSAHLDVIADHISETLRRVEKEGEDARRELHEENREKLAGRVLEYMGMEPSYADDPNYVDNITGAHYYLGADVSPDESFWVDHQSAGTVYLSWYSILEDVQSPQGGGGEFGFIYYERDRESGVIYPSTFGQATTPNIADHVRDIQRQVDEGEVDDRIDTLVALKITLHALGVAASGASATGTVKTGARREATPRSRLSSLEPDTGGGQKTGGAAKPPTTGGAAMPSAEQVFDDLVFFTQQGRSDLARRTAQELSSTPQGKATLLNVHKRTSSIMNRHGAEMTPDEFNICQQIQKLTGQFAQGGG